MFGLHLVTSAKLDALKAAGHDLGTATTSGLSTAIALASQAGNPIGAAARNAIDLMEASGKSGPEKKTEAVSIVAQTVVAEAARGGLSAALADAETFAGLVVEEVLSQVKKTSIVSIGLALLKLLGINLSVKASAPAVAPAPAAA